jgi:hypothetical protein
VKHYDPNATGDVGLFLFARVYTSVGNIGVLGRSITVRISYTYGGITFNDVVTLGPTNASGVARACPANTYPAAAQLTISTDPIDNLGGPIGPGLGDVQVTNQPRDARPGFCP